MGRARLGATKTNAAHCYFFMVRSFRTKHHLAFGAGDLNRGLEVSGRDPPGSDAGVGPCVRFSLWPMAPPLHPFQVKGKSCCLTKPDGM
jgi:hypothetical protein